MTKEFNARNERKSRSVCAAMAEAADTGKRVLTEREREILDMWPRFEDGELVMVGDRVGHPVEKVGSITILESAFVLCDDAASSVQHERGQCVKRPAPEVLDADGVEIKVGDTVWHEDGSELHVIGFGDVQDGETMLAVEYAAGPTKWGEVRCLSVTHTRPDSWEQLEEDAVKVVCEYAGAVPDEFGDYDCDTCRLFDARGKLICEQQMALDIVRRAKAIAGGEGDG